MRNKETYVQTIFEARRQIDILTKANERIQGIIFTLNIELTAVEQTISSLNISIEEITKQINSLGTNKETEIRQIQLRIQTIGVQIHAQTNEASRLETIATSLEGSLAEFKATVDRHYNVCYKVEEDDGSAFLNYLKEVFGSVPNPNIRARFSGEVVKIKHSTIFSPSWIRVYGLPFSGGYGNSMDIMDLDFQCEEVADLEILSGVIASITQNVINVKDHNGDIYTVHLGGCTRLETARKSEIPEVGNEIIFKGRRNKSGKRSYRGYHVTCY